VINEVLTNPRDVNWDGGSQASQAQWLELYNGSGGTVCLGNWRITTADVAHPATLPAGQCMAAQGYLVIFKRDIGLDLAQGPLSLVDPNGNVADSVSPPALPPDQSYARLPDGSANWIVTTGPTLNSANVLPPEATSTPDLQATVFAVKTQLAVLDDDSPDATDAADARRRPSRSRKGQAFRMLSIADIRGLPDDTAVITSGTVTMPTGLWEPTRAYIQADGAGILIHSYGATSLRLGDTLNITGRVHHVRGEVEIAAIKNGEQASPGGILPAARLVAPGAIGGATEALLVQVAGRVDQLERDYATVADEAASARVFLYGRLNFGASALRDSTGVTIIGVVNAADGSPAEPAVRSYAQRLLVSTHRLVPRLVSDIVVQAAAAGSSSPSDARDPAVQPPTIGQAVASRSIGSAEPISVATAFVTPVLSSRGGLVGVRAQAAPGPNVLVLGSATAHMPRVWIAVGAGLLALGGGAASFLMLRWKGKERQPPGE